MIEQGLAIDHELCEGIDARLDRFSISQEPLGLPGRDALAVAGHVEADRAVAGSREPPDRVAVQVARERQSPIGGEVEQQRGAAASGPCGSARPHVKG